MMNNKTKGILFMLMSSLGFAFMAVSVKYIGNIPLFEKIFFRNIVSLSVTLWSLRKIGSYSVLLGKKGNRGLLAGRCIAGFLGLITNFYAISNLPLANANIITKMAPFLVLFFSAYYLKEKVRRIQVIGFIISFASLFLIIKPSLDFDVIPSAVAFLSAVFAGIAYTLVRALGNRKEYPETIIFAFSFVSVVGSFPIMMMNYVRPSFVELMILLSIGVFATFGQFGLTYAYKYSEASEVSIYRYSEIVISMILGYFIFGEVPDLLTIIGATIIVLVAVKLYYVFKGEKD